MSHHLAILKAALTQKLQRIPPAVLEGSIQDVQRWLDIQQQCARISKSRRATEDEIKQAIQLMESFYG